MLTPEQSQVIASAYKAPIFLQLIFSDGARANAYRDEIQAIESGSGTLNDLSEDTRAILKKACDQLGIRLII